MSQEDIDAAFDELDEEEIDLGLAEQQQHDAREHLHATPVVEDGTSLDVNTNDGDNQAAASTPAPLAQEATLPLPREPTTATNQDSDASGGLKVPVLTPAAPTDAATVARETAAPLARPAIKPSFSRPAFKPPAAHVDPGASASKVTEAVPTVTKKSKAKPSKPAASTAKQDASGPPDPSKGGKRKKGDGKSKPSVPRGKSAYIFFCQAKRAEVKAAQPSLTATEVVKELGTMWNALTPDEKAPFKAQAEEDKARAAAQRALMPPSEDQDQAPKSKAKAPRAPKAPKQPKTTKTTTQPGEHADDQTLSAQEGKTDGSDAAPARAAANDSSPAAEASATPDVPGSKVVRRNKPRSEEARGSRAAVNDADDANDTKGDAEDAASDSEDEHETCDWDAHPAEAIVCKTAHGKYVIKRKGLGYDGFGLVDISAAKRQCVRDGMPCPVSVDMVNKHETLEKSFFAEAHARTSQGELDLDDLQPGSHLEMVAFLGNLREPDFPLHKLDNKKSAVPDVMMGVPLMRTCMIFQNMLNIERAELAAVRQELTAAKNTIKQMEAGAGAMTAEQ